MSDWKNPTDYCFTEDLAPAEWAWQFLRRNPAYQSDWQWFAATWSALEAEYGQPPQRDYHRWQQDPRAYRQAAVNESEETEALLIECWMGQKWGFYKFPIDPAVERPQPGIELLWREMPLTPPLVEASDSEWLGSDPAKVACGFDLRQPLTPQLEQVQRFLQVLQKQRAKQGTIMLETSQQHAEWCRYLRYLDAEAAEATDEQIMAVLQPADLMLLRQRAHEMIQTGYRRILQLSKITTRTKTV